MAEWTWKAQKRKCEDESSFEDTYHKYYKLEDTNLTQELKCFLSPNCEEIAFETFQEYDDHYMEMHVHSCSQCRRTLPSAHMLHLHLLEFHDSYFATRKTSMKIFECYVEGCKKKFKSPYTRKRHLIDKHKYPTDYHFYIIKGERRKDKMAESMQDECKDSVMENFISAFSNLQLPRQIQLKKPIDDSIRKGSE
jgi:hypothetical protein